MKGPRLAIGSSHRFETRLSPDDCARRLRQRFRPVLRPGRADTSGFLASTGLRSVIRIRGGFEGTDNRLTAVDYWIALKPYMVFTWLAVTPVSLAVVHLEIIIARCRLTCPMV